MLLVNMKTRAHRRITPGKGMLRGMLQGQLNQVALLQAQLAVPAAAAAAAVIGVITLNVLIGMIQEGKAEKAAEAIKAMLSATGALLCYLLE
jgi:magnesium-transporting ATPase (P-type)